MKYYYPELTSYTIEQCFRRALEREASFFIYKDFLYKIEREHPLGYVKIMDVEEFVENINNALMKEVNEILNQ